MFAQNTAAAAKPIDGLVPINAAIITVAKLQISSTNKRWKDHFEPAIRLRFQV
jgi:hypothetical protein